MTPQTSPLRTADTPPGFTLVELLCVAALIGVVATMAVPMTASSMAAYRLKNDAQAVYNLVTLAKMRAASRFTRTRLYVDRAANTYRLEVLDRTANAWVTEGQVRQTSWGVTFGFGGLAVPPPNTQNVIGQSGGCTDGSLPDGLGPLVANTSCIVFNSRGVPIQMVAPNVGVPNPNNAIYLTDGSAVYAATVTATPLVRWWWSPSGNASWVQQ